MKAPSAQCLRTLRAIAYGETQFGRSALLRRCYASLPDQTQRQAPPPPPSTPYSPAPPPPAFSARSAADRLPGYKKRGRADDDEEFMPQPLARPIGMPNPPRPGENMGLDNRSRAQRREDFANFEKHMQRRAKMTKQISKPYFRDWSNLRFFRGKQFKSNERLFRGDASLWFPNFFGKTLNADAKKLDTKDGYGGLGRDTFYVMDGKVSVVSIVTCHWAQEQVDTFCSEAQNPELHQVLSQNSEVAQMVRINHEDNILRWWLLQAFRGNLRQQLPKPDHDRYFMVRRGVDEMMKESIGLLNEKVGYVYLVDAECKIRWAGSADAEPAERESMVRGLKRLIQEAKTPREQRTDTRKQLVDAVAEVTEDQKQAAVG